MATKNISITEEAYKRLANLRKGNESFSEIIVKVTKKDNWRNYFGSMPGESGKKFEKAILDGRKLHAKLHAERNKRLIKEFS